MRQVPFKEKVLKMIIYRYWNLLTLSLLIAVTYLTIKVGLHSYYENGLKISRFLKCLGQVGDAQRPHLIVYTQ